MKFTENSIFKLSVILVTCLTMMVAAGGRMTATSLVWAQSLSGEFSHVSNQARDAYLIYLPMVMMSVKEEEPPDEPPMTTLYVKNSTGGKLCYEVRNTGVGKKCFSSGQHFYGEFPSGTYTYYASAICGSITERKYFNSGEIIHEFWCQ